MLSDKVGLQMRAKNCPRVVRIPELLAPAGDFEALKAAVENGADAVYLGGKNFNARASASNFDFAELKKALTYAHERQVKVYVTVNILVADSEFLQLADYLYALYSFGVDALIVQDIGVARFSREVLPEMKIHASTQMTQNNSLGLKQLEKMGFSRVVLARETSALEIEKIVQGTKLDVEVFVHGALCVSYSGQCLMSSYIGARSGNRGRCAQPCRLAYQLIDEQGRGLIPGKKQGDYLLSPRDLNLSENLAQLQKIGVSSLKIEGRMKRPEYVATVVRIYRKTLDSLELEQDQEQENQSQHLPRLDRQDRQDLIQIFNRGFTTGYFINNQGSGMMSYQRPNNRGTLLGRIVEAKKNRITLQLENILNNGDGLEIPTKYNSEGIVVNKIYNLKGRAIKQGLPGEKISLAFSGAAKVGAMVYKTYDQDLMERAKLSFQEGKEKRKRTLRMKLAGRIGKKLNLEVWDGEFQVEVESLTAAQEAVHRPLEYNYLYKQLGRLGNTPFTLRELELDLKDDLIIPVREINELRRQAIAKLLEKTITVCNLDKKSYDERVKDWNEKTINFFNHSKSATQKAEANFSLSVAIADLAMLDSVIKAGADRIIIGGEHWRIKPVISLEKLYQAVESCADQGIEAIWRLPRIINDYQSEKILSDLKEIALWPKRPTVMAANLAGIELIKSIDSSWPWETDHFFPVFNQAALLWVLEAGGKKAALSTELSQEQLKTFSYPSNTEIIVFGDMEMMVSEYCLIGSLLSKGQGSPREKCGRICQKKDYYLKDRFSYHFPLETDRECRMHIFNAKRLNLITELAKIADRGQRSIRLELPRATLFQVENTVQIFKKLWIEAAKGKISKENTDEAIKNLDILYPEGFTRGHFFRGVLT